MRPITRNLVVGLLVVTVLLLALGAAPSLLRSGDPYYVTATPAEGAPGAAKSRRHALRNVGKAFFRGRVDTVTWRRPPSGSARRSTAG